MTDTQRPTFERHWPELASRVNGSLARRGVPPWLRDDIVQETGLRLFKMWHDVDPDRSPYGLALTIANNLLWDSVQRNREREILGEIPDSADAHDVERASIARLELARVGRSMRDLSPAHRGVLLAELDDQAPRPAASPAAVKMLRMRARRRLTALLEQASAVGGLAGLEFRKRALRLRAFLERNHLVVDGAAAAVTSVVATVTLITGVSVIARADSASQIPFAGSVNVRASAGTAEVSVLSGAGDANRPINGNVSPSERSATEERKSPDEGYEVWVGEGGPVEGGATVAVRDKENGGFQVTPPDCSVSQPSEHEVQVSCRGSVNSTEIDTTLTVKARP